MMQELADYRRKLSNAIYGIFKTDYVINLQRYGGNIQTLSPTQNGINDKVQIIQKCAVNTLYCIAILCCVKGATRDGRMEMSSRNQAIRYNDITESHIA